MAATGVHSVCNTTCKRRGPLHGDAVLQDRPGDVPAALRGGGNEDKTQKRVKVDKTQLA